MKFQPLTLRSILLAVPLIILLLAGCVMPEPLPEAPPATDPAPAPTAAVPLASGVAEPRTVESRPIEGNLPFNQRGWDTDFTKRSVDYSEIRSGGPPKDGIPALNSPTFESVADAGSWLTDTDPVIVYEHEGTARAYPLAILIWHEIVNDEINGRPVTVTFCPLCNASVVFDRRVGEQVLDFGTTGNLRNSDLVMYDRQTESWWQQFTGEAIVGEYTTTQLTFLASQVLSFGQFRELYPSSEVLRRPLDLYSRSYGTNPYSNYDTYGSGLSRGGNLVLFTETPDERLMPLDRVVGLLFADKTSMAIPFDAARDQRVIHLSPAVGELELVVFHQDGMSSALSESDIGTARDIGSVGVFHRMVEGETLTFQPDGNGRFLDDQTGSLWNIRGQATEGPLAGASLVPHVAFDHFWFAWAAFLPDTELYELN